MTINEFIQTYINDLMIQAYWYGFWVATSVITLALLAILTGLYLLLKREKNADIDEAIDLANSHSN